MAPADSPSPATPPTPSRGMESTHGDRPVQTSVWRSTDAAVTLVISVVFAFIVLGLTFVSQLEIAIRCQSSGCTDPRLSVGDWLYLAAPWIVLAASFVVSVVLIVRRRRAFYIPLLGIALAIVVTAVGDALLR